MSGFKFDPSKPGLRKTLRAYEELTLRHIWSVGEEGATSGSTWKTVNIQLGPDKSISRASVIFALNRFVDQGVLGWRDATGKGGHHKIYHPLMDEEGYVRYRARDGVPEVRSLNIKREQTYFTINYYKQYGFRSPFTFKYIIKVYIVLCARRVRP